MIGIALPTTPAGSEANSQFQPLISTSSRNCVPNTGRKLMRRATVDAIAPSTAACRKWSGAPDTRGLTYGEMATAAAHFGVTLTPMYGNTRQEMFDLVDAGHAVGISIDCSVTVNTERRTGSYTGDHTIYGHDVRHVPAGGKCLCEKRNASKAHNEYLIEDPGNTSIGYQWWSASLVYRAAEARTTDHNGISHGINLLVAPDTEGVKWKCVMTGRFRSEPRKDSADLGPYRVGTIYPGGRTENGGTWERRDGTLAHGWIHLRMPNGRWAWARGEAMVRV